MKHWISIAGILLFAVSAVSQTTFKKRFGSGGDDEPWAVEVFSDGSFIVAGHTTDGGLGGQDALLVKFTANGTLDWSRSFGGSGTDAFVNLLVCTDGNLLAIGETSSFGAGAADVYIVKFDPSSGNPLWQRTAGGGNVETGQGACEVSDGYIITGGTQSLGAGFWDIYVQKLDFSGNQLWSATWGGGGGDIGYFCTPAAGGDVWVSGFTYIGSPNNHDAVLLRISSVGATVSARRAGGANSEGFRPLLPGGPGLVAGGGTWSYSGGTQVHPWIAGFNADGTLNWSKRYPVGSTNHELNNLAQTPDGGLVFTLFTPNNEGANAYLVKTDGTGNVIWAKSHAFNGTGRMRTARPTPDGGYLALGYVNSGNRDLFILKTDAQGIIADCCPSDAPINAIAVTPATPLTTQPSATGPGVGTPAASDQTPGLSETNLCTGPACCISDAGSLNYQYQEICANLTAVFTHNGDQVLDGNDLLQFILYTNSSNVLGSIVAVSNTPVFTFSPPMVYNAGYFVAAIAGNALAGNVDLSDPCLNISNASVLVWLPLPSVQFLPAGPDLCAGDCQTIQVALEGTPPFTLVVNQPFSGNNTYIFTTNNSVITVCAPPGTPPGPVQLQALSLSDDQCSCQ